MKANERLKQLALIFVGVLAFYAIAYYGIEHRRTRLGSWRVTFTNNPSGAPALIINEPALSITNVQILFPQASLPTNFSPKTILFDRPQPVPYPLPFGDCIFMDTTFLPGTVVLRLQNQEIQLLPRVLTVDKQERPWRSGESIVANAPITP